MPLSVGDKLGHYEVLSLLGQGGMGEVYRARDTTLKRDVALKVLPAAFLRDHERMARFQREAEVLASLDHPNIGPIHGMVESGDSRALVLALIEGPTLADRIEAGPLPHDEAVAIAKQIIEALEYAHDRGVVHRDLKPANVKITSEGVVKVLDFGLAKVLEEEPATSSLANSPTLTIGHTRAGVILGTAAYMSPEQAVGRPVDRRSDIFSFGSVLYEMLTGTRAFAGATTPDVLEAVVKKDPDWSKLPAETSGVIHQLLRRCLAKDRKQRLQAIGEARIALENPAKEVPLLAETRTTMRWVWPVVAGALAIGLAALAWIHFREQPPVAEVTRFQFSLPTGATFPGPIAPEEISPDGRKLAFVALDAGGMPGIWMRSLDSVESRLLAGTDVGPTPQPFFWSPDSRFIAFMSMDRKLKKIDISGGPPQTLCEAGDLGGGSWSRDGVILFGGFQHPIERVPEAGGTPTPLTVLDSTRQELAHLFPKFLPDGRHFLYFRFATAAQNGGIYVGSIDGKPSEQSSKPLLANQAFPAYYVPSENSAIGHLLFYREGTVLAQSFNPSKLALSGDPVPIAEQVGNLQGFGGFFSASANGVLAFLSGSAGGNAQLTWFDRQGKNLGTVGEPANISDLVLSPDGKQAVVGRVGSQAGINGNLWLYDLARGGAPARFTFDSSVDGYPVWSPDGSRIVFWSLRDGPGNLYQKLTSGAKNEEILFKSDEQKFPYSWSHDGHFLAYSVQTTKSKDDIWILPMDESQKTPMPMLFQGTEFNETGAQFSPDGHWIAYMSDASGRIEVYVREFSLGSDGKPEATAPHLISSAGGASPHWRDDGKELFYISADRKAILSADIVTKPVFQSTPTKLSVPLPASAGPPAAVAGDGQRFLVPVPVTQNGPQQFTVVLNWETGLKK